jgi:hypothetical protein
VTPAEALAAVRASLARGSSTPALRQPRETYIAEEARRLESALIPPVQATVVAETFHYGLLQQLSAESLFAIARRDQYWLLYRPNKQAFSLAFGPSADNLTVLGFSSGDALAEWLG